MKDELTKVRPMLRGGTDAETCRLNGWEVGTLVRGHEQWERGGVWSTWRITAIGEDTVLVRSVEREYTGGVTGRPRHERGVEHCGTFRYREWRQVMACMADHPPHEAHEWDYGSDEVLWCPGVGVA